jgi:RNA recognition motif-containing protein
LAKKLYVGNIPFTTTDADLRSMFEAHGAVTSVKVITDRETGRSRGFAFVEMDDATAAANAIRALDGSQMGGRSLRVNEAQDRREGGGGGGGFGGGGGGGGRGGYGGGGGGRGGYGGGSGGGGRGGYGGGSGGGGGYGGGGGGGRDRDRY